MDSRYSLVSLALPWVLRVVAVEMYNVVSCGMKDAEAWKTGGGELLRFGDVSQNLPCAQRVLHVLLCCDGFDVWLGLPV